LIGASARASLEQWLDARRPAPPAALRDRMVEAMAAMPATESMAAAGPAPDADTLDLPAALAGCALHIFASTLHKWDDRAGALDLLAADALLTYAFEAAAEQGGSAVADVSRLYGAAQLELLVGSTDA
jgi:hypothetical protein